MSGIVAAAALLFASAATVLFSGYTAEAGIVQDMLLLTMTAAGFVTISAVENLE